MRACVCVRCTCIIVCGDNNSMVSTILTCDWKAAYHNRDQRGEKHRSKCNIDTVPYYCN